MTTNNAVNSSLSGTTGTGNLVGSTSPSITTPKIITQINDTNGNALLGIIPAASAVNFINIENAATTTSPVLAASGSDTNVIMTLNGQGTGGVAIHGTGTNDSANAGYVGEFKSSIIASGSAISLTTATPANVTSLSLTAGDWLVMGNVQGIGSASNITALYCWASTVSATLPDSSLYNDYNGTIFASMGLNIPVKRISLASTTTIYLSCEATFATGTATACGGIFAWRMR